MKKALLIAMDRYNYYQGFDGRVQSAACDFCRILRSSRLSIFGDVSLKENERYNGFLDSLDHFFQTAEADDELLFYFIGHAIPLSDKEIALLPVDAKPDTPKSLMIPSRLLVDMLFQAKAHKVSVILECCHGGIFLEGLRSRAAKGGPYDQGKQLQVLCNANDTYVRSWRPSLTGGILDGIRTGAAGGMASGNDAHVTLRDIALYLSSTNVISQKINDHLFSLKKIMGDPMADDHSLLKNPLPGKPIPREAIFDLYSGDSDRMCKAVRNLGTMAMRETGTVNRDSAAWHTIETFIDNHPEKLPEIRFLLPESERASEARIRFERDAVHVCYHWRNEPFAQAARAYFEDNGIPCRLCNLDHLSGLNSSNKPNALAWIGNGAPSLWIADGEFTRRLRSRYPEIHIELGNTPPSRLGSRAVYWVGKDAGLPDGSLLARCGLTGDTDTPVEQFAHMLAMKVFSHHPVSQPSQTVNPATCLSIETREQEFLGLLETHDEELKKHLKRPKDFPTAHILHEPPREPNFLIYERAGSFIMAIVDKDASVDETALQYTFEPQAKARLATVEEVRALGFEPDRITPMWLDPGNRITRIFVDANIFFQYLMFPLSKIILPKYHVSDSEKAYSTASSFIRTLQKFHGEQKIVFANIIRKKVIYDRMLISLLSKQHVFTRFAPTPSNSLHIGSLRTAVISYLFSRTNASQGRFHIRFDDTNPNADVSEGTLDVIRNDLEWIGIPSKQNYRQTSSQATERYNTALTLLQRSGVVTERADGSLELRLDLDSPASVYWLDLRHGPRVVHKVPLRSPNDRPLDFSLTWVPEHPDGPQRFKYKFAGAIDDMINNSLVVRDIRQEDSAFTSRQSLFMGIIRDVLAFPRDGVSKGLGQRLKDYAQKRIVNHSPFRPFPFPCPPVYLHVSRVVDQDGTPLSKRMLRPEHTVSFMRQYGTYFPETILTWTLYSLGMPFYTSLGYPTLEALTQAVTSCGPHGFLAELGGRVNPEMLWRSRQSQSIRIDGLKKIDRIVLAKLPPYRLYGFVESLCAGNGLPVTDATQELAQRLFERRCFFAGAREVASVAVPPARGVGRPVPDGVTVPEGGGPPDDGRAGEWLATLNPEAMKWVRLCVCGSADGPPLRELLYVLGTRQFLARLREGREHHG